MTRSLPLLLLAACVTTTPPAPSGASSSASPGPSTPDAGSPGLIDCRSCAPEVPQTPEGCVAVGGVWVHVGPARKATCSLPAHDAGKACRDHRDCESVCVTDGAIPAGAKAEGRCHPWSVLAGACVNLVEDGVALGQVCLD